MVLISLVSCNLLEPMVTPLHSPAPPTLQPTNRLSATPLVTLSATEGPQATASLTPSAFTPTFSQVNATTTTPQLPPSCDRAAPGEPLDVSIADDANLLPGQAFLKTWRLVNDGACTWTREYAVVYFSGSQMGALARNNLIEEASPGKAIDISLDMIAPEKPGVYQGNWKLSNAKGQLFGLGPNGDAPFWVRIIVVEPATDTPFPPSPTPTTTSTPVVYVTGEVTLNSKDSLDLDMKAVTTDTTADVYYIVIDKHTHRLEPVNNARLGAPSGNAPPTYLECQSATLSTEPLVLDTLAINTTFCYRTNLGLPGWARLVSISPKNDVLTLEILTWAIP